MADGSGGPYRKHQMRDSAVLDKTRQPIGRKLFQVLGPGLITGAADDDPSGIATYSQVGAQFGYGLAWTLVFSYPLMVAIQKISARIGRVTGFGIAGNLGRHYSGWLSGGIVLLLLFANLINLGADLGPLTFVIFAVGIIGTGMLALAGSAAYALSETLSWHVRA